MVKDRRYEDGKACFTTSHLSVYAVTYEATGAEGTEEGGAPYSGPYSDGGGCNAGTGAAALAAMAAAVLAGKRRKD